mgnify:FL=1
MNREDAIKHFIEMNVLEENARATLARILSSYKPSTLLFAWEGEGGLGITTLPSSRALLEGMIGLICSAIHPLEEEPLEGEDAE